MKYPHVFKLQVLRETMLNGALYSSELNGQAVYAHTRDGRCKIDSDNRGTLHKVGNRRVGRRVNKERKCGNRCSVHFLRRVRLLIAIKRARRNTERKSTRSSIPRIRTTRIPMNKMHLRTKECLESMLETRMERRRKENKFRTNIDKFYPKN